MPESNNSDDKTEIWDGQADVAAFSARLRDLAQRRSLTRPELIERTGLKKQSFAGYWNGERVPPAHALLQLSEILDCDPRWLLNGEGEDRPVSGEAARWVVPELKSSFDDLVEVAEVDLRYGLGGAFVDEESIEVNQRQFSRQWLRTITDSPPSLLFWARTQGNSMSPTIEDGEIVLGDRSQTRPEYDDLIWACALGEIGMIKRLRIRADHVKILSDNPNVPEDVAHPDDNLQIIGRIIAVVKNL